jgi:ribosomal protein S18 acetylase RimI-like enzyme
MTLRLATPADLQAVLKMVRDFHLEEGLRTAEPAVTEAVTQLLTDPSTGRIWLITANDGTTAGYIVLTFGFSIEFRGRDAFIDELYVIPAHRGRGLGKQAIEQAAENAREIGVHALHLEVAHGNQRALELYRRMDFKDHDRFLMTKWLDGMV